MKKISLLAVSVSLALTGCFGGSDNSSTPSNDDKNPTPTAENRFIDSAVEGLYYETGSGQTGFTDAQGHFNSTAGDSVRFYLGGENGLPVGAVSSREVTSPFEATGKFDRAVNLAILLQSLDADHTDGTLTIPADLKEHSAAFNNLDLNERQSVLDFITGRGLTPVSEEAALKHLHTNLSGLQLTEDAANPFKQPGTYLRSVGLVLKQTQNNHIYVHADKTLPTNLFNSTRGTENINFAVTETGVTELAGSNDRSLSEDWANQYLCEQLNGIYTSTSGSCSAAKSPVLAGSSPFRYNMLDPTGALQAPVSHTWQEMADFGLSAFEANSTKGLNHYTETYFDDRNDGAAEADWQHNIISNAYDATTGVMTVVRQKTVYGNCNPQTSACVVQRQTQQTDFTYPVPAAGEERYVDFTGTWQEREVCADGQIALANHTFSTSGYSRSGNECNNGTSVPLTEQMSMSDLSQYEMWWFGQSGIETKATLTELNSVVRYCDSATPFNPDTDTCASEDINFVKWQYQPAGKDWDQGLLIRTRLNPDNGSVLSTSTLKKQ